jgi:hypothetical protein
MKKLLLLSLLSTAVCAMDVAPEPVAMSDDAPSFISKEGHKLCCAACCGSVFALPSACLISYGIDALQHSHQQCGNSLGCNYYERYRTSKMLNPVRLTTVLFAPPITGYLIGLKLGKKTFELDQRLHARLITQKEKSE